ncbi:F-box domain-containing protein [Coniochaeta sp. 2T2.1]|nr:F-box domain-containing protein [Coniochaeta sp. 2T2.1]
MQQELTATSHVYQTFDSPSSALPTSQHGFPRSQQQHHADGSSLFRTRSSSSSRSGRAAAAGSDAGLDADQLEERLRRLSHGSHRSAGGRPSVAGQRISEYEKALTPSVPRQALGFKVTKRSQSPPDGVQLTDFPNEILTHILSHLHPDSHAAVALVSKRFYALVTTPHAWRMAFLRYFPGQDVMLRSADKEAWHEQEDPDLIRSEQRYFSRLSPLASWRSEYLLRTRLLRSVARGKPGTNIGGVGSSAKSSQMGKRSSAVLTYNSKLPWTVSNLHAVFSNGKKPPKVISGTAALAVGTSSDPTIGKVDKWGLDDPFAFAQLDEAFPDLEPFAVAGEGPAAVPNVMDVSQPYGFIGGEGFPGGRAYYRAASEIRGRYLGNDSAIIDMVPEIPKIPELSEAICSVWIAKSSAVPTLTQSMVGMMTGSTLGVVTTYALNFEASGSGYSNGQITGKWVLSPGIPIVAIKIDDNYSQRRKILGRVWAVALNALGEVYYLKDTPSPPVKRVKGEDPTRTAWMSGRTVYWELVESTRRRARPDEFDKNAVRGAYSPRSPSNSMNLSKNQVIAEAREIEKFLRHKPSHFRKACEGWDMRRKLEVDFGGGEEDGGGEGIFVITCGLGYGVPAGVTRYTRRAPVVDVKEAQLEEEEPTHYSKPEAVASSLFGGPTAEDAAASDPTYPAAGVAAAEPEADAQVQGPEEWAVSEFELKPNFTGEITASAVDATTYAVMARFEDPLLNDSGSSNAGTPTAQHSTGEISGRRARLFAVGTDTGAIYVWNMRAAEARAAIKPLRCIQTDSPEISCLALSALYIIHGGSDGLVQAWDPLASVLEPVRTLNAKSSGRIPRHIVNANPVLRQADYAAVGAIYLDPDPAVLRGVLSFGTFIRYWAYNSTHHGSGRKRRVRHSDVNGRLASRRLYGTVSGYIAAEEAELRREQAHRAKEQVRLRNRFGVGLGDLTEEEAIKYAEMISQESYMLDEQRRFSASDTGSAADINDTASSAGSSMSSADTLTPEPSISGRSPNGGSSALPVLEEETEDDYEAQIQRAIRLSLMEGVNDAGQSPRDHSSGDYGFPVTVKEKKKKGRRASGSPPPSVGGSEVHAPVVMSYGEGSRGVPVTAPLVGNAGVNPDEDLELALRLSLEEEETRQATAAAAAAVGLGVDEDAFPPLSPKGKGKGKGVA